MSTFETTLVILIVGELVGGAIGAFIAYLILRRMK